MAQGSTKTVSYDGFVKFLVESTGDSNLLFALYTDNANEGA